MQRIGSRNGLKRYAKNTGWMLAEQGFRIISGLFIGIWIARHLGVEQFGIFSYVIAITSVLSGITNLGLHSVLTRELVKFPGLVSSYLGTAFRLKVISSASVVVAVLGFMISEKIERMVGYCILLILIGQVIQSVDVLGSYFLSKVEARIISLCKIIQILISSVIKVLLIILDSDLVWFVAVLVVDSITLAASYHIAYRANSGGGFYSRFESGIAIKLLKDSLPLMLGGLGFAVFSNTDIILLKNLAGSAEAGVYASAYKLMAMWYFFPGLILSSILPALVQSQIRPNEYKIRKQMITTFLVWFAIGLATITSLFSHHVISFTYGSDFEEAAEILSVLIWANVLIFFNSCWNQFQMIEEKSRFVLYFHLLVAVVNIPLNLLFISVFGLMGSAYALIGSLLLGVAIFMFLDKGAVSIAIGALSFGRIDINVEKK